MKCGNCNSEINTNHEIKNNFCSVCGKNIVDANNLDEKIKCPACGYERQDNDISPLWQCPSCKIAYNKYDGSNNINNTINQTQELSQRTSINKSKLLLFIVLLAVITLVIIFLKSKNPQDSYKPVNIYKNTHTFQMPKQNSTIHNELVKLSINLGELLVKTNAILKLAQECSSNCKNNNEVSQTCTKTNNMWSEINNDLERLKNFYRYNQRKFSTEELKFVNDIRNNITNIASEMEIAKTFCTPSTEYQVNNYKKNINLKNHNINLFEIQRDITVMLGFAEKCADSCVRYEKYDVNCKAFFEYHKKSAQSYKYFINFVNKNGLNAFSEKDKKLIIKIDNDNSARNKYVEIIEENCR
ncbi:TPA: hypothetical protein JBH48_14460 [Legionella pneumophila]|nr:hypothetical protein [Legionella pneumophila]